MLFNSPRLDDRALAGLYGRNYYFFDRSDAYAIRKTPAMYQRTVALVPGEPGPRRVLDVGCGRGYFPALLQALGNAASAVELSTDAAEYARAKFGLDVFTGTIEQYAAARQAGSISAEPFPLVTAIDVIEHVPDPAAFIAAAVRVLAPGGRLIIDTPNAAAANIAALGDEWQGFNPFHIYLYTPEALRCVVERAGLVVDRVFSYHNEPADHQRGVRTQAFVQRQLKRLGLIRPAARTFFAVRRWRMPRTGAADALREAASQAANAAGFDACADAAAPLAPGRQGDNLVLIARRV